MSIPKLMEFFSTFRRVPVEIPDIIDQITEEYKVADTIKLVPFTDDTRALNGVHSRTSRIVGNKVINEIHIPYDSSIPLDEQRITCCKELIHIFDVHPFHTKTPEGTVGLIKALINKNSRAKIGTFPLGAAKDLVAFHQAAGILVPEEMREEIAEHFAKELLDPGQKDKIIDFVATEFCIPVEYAGQVMLPEWPSLWRVFSAM